MKLFLKFLPIIVILLFAIFSSQKLINSEFYTSHDGEGHVIRLIEFDKGLRDGQFPVRLAGRINHGLSYPFFNFNYPLVYYAGETLHTLGFSFVDSFKLLLFFSVLLSGVGIYFLTKERFGILGGVISSIFTMLAPYTFLNMYVRGDVSESLGLSFFILLLLSIDKFIKNKSYVLSVVLVWSALLLSHNITALLGSIIACLYFLYLLLKQKEKKYLFVSFFVGGVITLLLTAFFWVPVLFETHLTKLVELTEDYKTFFPTFRELIYSPWGFGPFKEGVVPGEMSPQIGLLHLAVFIGAVCALIMRIIRRQTKEKDRFVLFFILLSCILFFLASPLSRILWDVFYPIRYIQIPWRLVGYITIACSVSAGFLVSLLPKTKTKVIGVFILILLLLYVTRNQIRVNMFVSFYNPFLSAQVYGPSTTSKDEHMPRFAPRIYNDLDAAGELFASTSGTFKRDIWKSNYHKFAVDTKQDAQFRDNTSYFPGWVGYVDGKEQKLLYKQDEFYRLRLRVPAGQHIVEFYFRETLYRKVSDILSLLTFCGIVMYVLWQNKILKKKDSKKLVTKSSAAKNAK